ncbi:CstA-like carbon starvation protein [Alkalihalobacillus alcalophilus ATCC 27647 = CGMCC 1.3604]|uniref:Carbon starvation protein CstA n=1 Tax=Alkalihalobacillus alcalophilus ATCC 27647 = CGMCC 1.3604 TaxID=1218173 RepID=A0A094WLB7_ALKAL|nr:carbon starvation CstA family protein [Alkalihalobacillus alcalophilus]KGA97656.1 carbon starvation protein CstA [Alkalihalobacillus alcalophilus ATCC 27647 = CGMCC 1.3604]MED1561309.1 carbon starvation CstA family protein [Alkalihalobacillus alcalophilus]THG91472.1 CstA-like carbon starvation protein [Alkalihalobacillus alcalophilus ATCC 27647 = CGMCC 1.3604]
MITFFSAIILLIIAYFTYGKFVEKQFRPTDDRSTPAYANNDGIDYVPMHKQKNALIQLLNIAGTGPIFGPIMGALFGPVAFIWIVVGAIFAGAVHDYLTGMISIRNRGAHIPELAGRFLGKFSRHVVNFFALLLLVLVGTVFITTPASLLSIVTNGTVAVWIFAALIILYYFLSTILPIDKIIGRVYPFFGAILLFGTIGVGIALLFSGAKIPELTIENLHPDNLPIFPILFFTITCGALSGFHATQSPIISRTVKKESEGRYIFYGMMIAEAIIAMIWAAAAMSLFHGEALNELIAAGTPSAVVNEVSITLLGAIAGTIAVLGVIVLPITSGDTAFRAARSIIADYLNINQKKTRNRLMIALPLFAIAYGLMQIDFNILWRYFSWANQATAVIALWIATMYLFVKGRQYIISLIPALFMTYMVLVYILNAQIGFNIDLNISFIVGIVLTIFFAIWFFWKANKNKKAGLQVDLEVDETEVKTKLS